MNRREFAQRAVAIVVLSSVLFTSGCTANQAQEVAASGAAVSAALLSIAAIEQATNPTLAADLTTAATTLKSATANFQTGDSLAIINSAAAVAQTVLAEIPATSQYAPLVAIAVAALDAILAATGNTSVAASAHTVSAHTMVALSPSQQANLDLYREIGKGKIKHRLFRSKSGDFEAAWQTEWAKSQPAR
jgi:hypothetical protein